MDMALRAGNHDVSIRGYPVANHVLRLGDESETGTPFADQYAADVVDWAVGTAKGLRQTSERVGGVNLYQSIAVPKDLKANRGLTVYGLLLHVFMVFMMVLSLVIAVVALVVKIRAMIRRTGPALGFSHGFGNQLLTLTVTTVATLALFGAGLGQVIMGVVKIAWGGAPAREARTHVLELAGHPGGVHSGGVGVVPRVGPSDRSGVAARCHPVPSAQGRDRGCDDRP